ncbi:PH-like domain-containing protein [Dietzia sp.]|uniref:PH-like domain-containing protein n=1 Tax=Dietzia sp. TaxID=1871616 RepID=UPI002FDAEAC8
MTQNVWTSIIAVLIVLGIATLMWRGWHGRLRRQSELLGALPEVPENLGEPLLEPLTGVYIGTTTAGEWNNRIAQSPLGFRSAGTLVAYPEGVLLNLDGGRIWIPDPALTAVRADSKIANKVVPGKGILVFTWAAPAGDAAGDSEASPGSRTVALDTGFRADDKDHYADWTALKESK